MDKKNVQISFFIIFLGKKSEKITFRAYPSKIYFYANFFVIVKKYYFIEKV